MPSYETSAERARRPLNVRAGEVTRRRDQKDILGSCDEDAPPAFHGPKIGGVQNFLDAQVAVSQHGTEEDTTIQQLAGTQVNISSEVNSKKKHKGVTQAPAGRNRVWACVSDEQRTAWNEFPSLWISSLCKSCLDSEEPCSGWEHEDRPVAARSKGGLTSHWSKEDAPTISSIDLFNPTVFDGYGGNLRCSACIRRKQPCLRMIEYENLSVDELFNAGEFRIYRTLERWSQYTRGTSIEIREENSHSIMTTSVASTPIGGASNSRLKKSPSASGPTYSQARNAYERLAEDNYHRQVLGEDKTEAQQTSNSFWWEQQGVHSKYFLPRPQHYILESGNEAQDLQQSNSTIQNRSSVPREPPQVDFSPEVPIEDYSDPTEKPHVLGPTWRERVEYRKRRMLSLKTLSSVP